MSYLKNKSGFSLVEVMASLAISAAVVTAMVYAYVYGIKRFSEVSSEFKMYEECSIALHGFGNIDDLIATADVVEVHDDWIRIQIPDIDKDLVGAGWVEIYHDNRDGTLRFKDRRAGENRFRVKMLPFGYSNMSRAYQVTSVEFTQTLFEGESMEEECAHCVKVTITMEDSTGTVVSMNSTTVLNNMEN